MVGAGHRGKDWEQRARGQSSTPGKYGRGCPGFLPGAWPAALLWCESRAAPLQPSLFCPSERKKENSITTTTTTKNPLCQPQIPKESTRQKGGKEQEEGGRSFPKQRFLQDSDRDPLPSGPAHRAGHEPLLRRVSPRQHPRPRDCPCLSPHKPHISVTDSSGKLLSLGIYSSTMVGDIFLCHLDVAWQCPGAGWHQLCLSPPLKAMWPSLQQCLHPSQGVNTSSLTAPRGFPTALCMNSPAPFPTTGL